MTDRKRKVATSDNDHQTLVRARRFLEDHGIDSAAIIHREDAAHFLVEFASFERESWRQMELARKVMEENREVLRKLAGG